MVCISCIVIPVVLYLWHRFLQPLFLRFWNVQGAVKDSTGHVQDASKELSCPLINSQRNESLQNAKDLDLQSNGKVEQANVSSPSSKKED